MLQTAVRVALLPSPLSLTVSLLCQQSWIGKIECTSVSVKREVPFVKLFAYGSGFPTLRSSGRSFDTDCPIVLTSQRL